MKNLWNQELEHKDKQEIGGLALLSHETSLFQNLLCSHYHKERIQQVNLFFGLS